MEKVELLGEDSNESRLVNQSLEILFAFCTEFIFLEIVSFLNIYHTVRLAWEIRQVSNQFGGIFIKFAPLACKLNARHHI